MINADEFAERRARLLALMDTNSALVLYSGVGKVSSADETYPFEVNRNFYYLTGIDQEDSALLLVNSYGEMKEFLFISPFDERKEKWYGKRLTPQEASKISGFKNIQVIDSLTAKIDEVLNPKFAVYGEVNKLYLDLDREIKIADEMTTRDLKKTLETTYPNVAFSDAYPLLTTLRLRKSVREIAELRSAIDTTQIGIYSVWSCMRPGIHEYELADLFLKTVNDLNGYEGLAFPTIMASGIHGTTLHYPTPMDALKDGDLLLSDLGSRKNYYCADVTRTVPVNGKFTPLQKQVYEIVLGCNKMIANKARPGITITDLQEAAVDYLATECLAAGFIENKEDIINYYFHNISHFIGLDTHDPYLSPLKGEYKKVPLEAGMVISDEPGLYMADRGIGIRIEDDLLITNDGCEVLSSKIIKEVSDIENALANKR